MPVYPGDPEVAIKQIHYLDKDGWNLRTIFVSTHLGTHVNVPIHMTENGKSLSQYSLDDFIGEAALYRQDSDVKKDVGVIFDRHNIDKKLANLIVKSKPKFVGLSEKFDFDVPLEKKLLEQGIISFENLTNLDKLPEKFTFYGIPLNIDKADGSPVRAFAVK